MRLRHSPAAELAPAAAVAAAAAAAAAHFHPRVDSARGLTRAPMAIHPSLAPPFPLAPMGPEVGDSALLSDILRGLVFRCRRALHGLPASRGSHRS